VGWRGSLVSLGDRAGCMREGNQKLVPKTEMWARMGRQRGAEKGR
jgi:hypothetical protein